MRRPPPGSTRTDTPFPYTPRVRSAGDDAVARTARPRLPLAGEPHLGAGLDPGGELEVDRLAVGQRDALHRLRRRVEEGNGEALGDVGRSEEHTSELQSLMRISYAVFCLKKNKSHNTTTKVTRQLMHLHQKTH